MTMTDKDTARAKDQARAQLDSIVAMVKRLEHCHECDGENNTTMTSEERDALLTYARQFYFGS